MSEIGKMVVFPEQMVEKSTMCANCVHFDADGRKNVEEWLPTREKDIARVKRGILLTGLQPPGLDAADVGLRVAQLTRDGKTSVTEAHQMVAAEIKQAALAAVGGDEELLYRVDKRYAIIAQTEQDLLSGKIGACRGGGEKANKEPVGQFVFSGFHCHKWTARAGASLAHEGRALDPLPEELVERANDKARAKARENGGE